MLAGGLAERMGECKVLLPICGRTALEIITSRMRKAGVGRIIVVTGGHEEKIRAEALRLACTPVHNPDYRSGMFSSVLAGVGALPAEAECFFLLPADTPLVKAVTYKTLSRVFSESRGELDVAYPTFGGRRGHPPIIGRTLIKPILEWSGDGGLRGFLDSYPCKSADVPTADRSTMLDMDTKEDYAALRMYAGREFYPDDDECAELLEIAGTPKRVAAHMNTVATVAEMLADALEKKNILLNRALLRSACLLHDIARSEKNHEAQGAAWLRERGYREVADIVASHRDLPRMNGLGEMELLYLADKVTDDDTVSTLENRMARMEQRFADSADALSAARRRIGLASEIRREVERATGTPLDKIINQSKLSKNPDKTA